VADSIRERILVALTENLRAIDGMDADRVLRNEPFATDAQTAPILILHDGAQSLDDGNMHMLICTARPTIEGQVWAVGGENPGSAANALQAAVLAAIAADDTLGDLAVDVRPTDVDSAIDGETGNEIAAFSISVEITFWTKPNDPTALAFT
jgi:hypothetical protein